MILETYTSLDEDQLRLPHLSTVCLCVRCEGLVILETYTSLDEDQLRLPHLSTVCVCVCVCQV